MLEVLRHRYVDSNDAHANQLKIELQGVVDGERCGQLERLHAFQKNL